jgi:DNA-binding Xre family transcriptional regulator
MAQHGDRTGQKVTYRLLSEKTGVATSTLSRIANNQQTMVSLVVIEHLCDFFGCELSELMRLESPDAQS